MAAMSDGSLCANCEAGRREAWVMFGDHRQPRLLAVNHGNYISLMRCEECNSLWCSSPYEPYLAFPYIVRWNGSELEWSELHHQDDGRSLLAWHAAALRSQWKSLPPAELAGVERHRSRTAHNPFDAPQLFQIQKTMLD
jgi:hypothetical protein